MSAQDIAKSFTEHYYGKKDSNPQELASLFQPQSMLTFEGVQVQGPQAICEKFAQSGRVNHKVSSIDVQPSTSNNAMIILVTGIISIDGNQPLHFTETIQLVSGGNNSFYVHNAVFRLIYGM